jgi:hypothetical protein
MKLRLLKLTPTYPLQRFLLFLFLIGISRVTTAQTYLSQDFESAWTGSNPQSPGAGTIPSGQAWTQTRTVLIGTGSPVSVVNNTAGEVDWKPCVWNATTNTWSSNPLVLSSTIANQPVGTPSGTGAAMMDDGTFGGITAWFGSRRLESPVINIASANNPYLRFLFHWPLTNAFTANARAVISTDGGTTWKVLSQIVPNGEIVGAYNSKTPWQVITIPIAAPLRTANVKIGFEYTNNASGQNLFIDKIIVDEYSPATITSAKSGLWSNPSTWVGGVVPNSTNNVVIAAGHAVSHDFNVTRVQNLTVNGKFTAANVNSGVVQAFGNVTVANTGIYNAYSASGVGFTRLYVGGSILNNGQMDFGRGNAAIFWCGNKAATYSGTGSFVNGFISQLYHANEGGVTYNAPVEVRGTVSLYTGTVTPNGNLTLGNYTYVTTQLIERSRGSFSAPPIFDPKVIRSITYLTSPYEILATGLTNTIDFEVPTINGVRLITGTLTLNGHYNWQLASAMTVGTGDQQGTGNLSLARGILISSGSAMLTLNLPGTGTLSGTAPNTNSPSTTQGSYITPPFRIQMPYSGTSTRTFPVGLGTETNTNNGVPTKNLYYPLTLSPGTTPWQGQLITINIYGSPTGATTAPLTAPIGRRTFSLTYNGGPSLPKTATVTLSYLLEDNLCSGPGELFIAQGNANGPWVSRMVTGLNAPGGVFNFGSTRVTSIAVNSDSLFCFATTSQVPKLWVGGLTGSWGTASNWSPAGVPTTNDDVNINDASGTGVTITGAGPFNCRNLNIANTSTVSISSATLNVSGICFLNGTMNVTSGGTVNINGINSIVANSLTLFTSSNLNVGTGGVLNLAATSGDNNRYAVQNGGVFSLTGTGIVNVNGGMNLIKGTFNMSGTSQFNVDPQGKGANLYSGNVVLGFGAGLYVNASGGTITLVDPSATNTSAVSTMVDVLIEGVNPTNNKKWTGSTFQFGNGVSNASAHTGQGGWFVFGGGFPTAQMGNLVINNPTGSNRTVKFSNIYNGGNTLTSTGMTWKTVNIIAGRLSLNGLILGLTGDMTNNGTIDASIIGSTIHFIGNTTQTFSGKGNFVNNMVRQLYVQNYGSTVNMNMNMNITDRLDINSGTLNGTGTLTLGNSTYSSTLNINRYGGSLGIVPVYNIAAPNLVNVNLSYIAPPANPLSYDFPIISQTTLTAGNEVPAVDTISALIINNSMGVTFPKGVMARGTSPLVLTSGIATFAAGKGFIATNTAATLPAPFTNATSWINGMVSVNINSATLVSRSFPVGGSAAGSARTFTIANMQNGGLGVSTISVSPVSGTGNTAGAGLSAVSTTRTYNAQVTGAPLTALGYVKILHGLDDNISTTPSLVCAAARIGYSLTAPPSSYSSLRTAANTMTDSVITDQAVSLSLGYFSVGLSTGGTVVKYTGPSNGRWNVAANWSSAAIPTSADEVLIDGNVVVNIPPSTTVNAKSLVIAAGSVLNDSANFTIDSNLIIQGTMNKIAGATVVGGVYANIGVSHISMVNGSALNISGGSLTLGNAPVGMANRNMSVTGDFTMTGGTLNVYGAISILGSTAPQFTNYTLSGGNINIYQQGTLTSLGASSAFIQSSTTDNTNMYLTGGTITLVDPNVNGTSDVVITNAKVRVLTGTTWAFGDGISTTAGNATSGGFSVNFSTNIIGNVIINNPSGTNRAVKISAGVSTYQNLTITAGTFNTNSLGLGILGDIVNNGTMNCDNLTTLSMLGTRSQTISGTGSFTSNRIGTLTISNSADTLPSVMLNMNVNITNGLNLILGSLGGSGTVTLGNSAKSTTFACTRNTGSMVLVPTFNFTGVTTTYTYDIPVPNTIVTTTGNELPSAVNTLVFTNNNGIGLGSNAFILNSPVTVNTALTLNSGIVQTTATNLLTLASTVTTPPSGSLNAFINGPLAIQVNGSANVSKTYAIGKGGQFRPMTVSAFHSNGTLQTYTGELVAGSTAGVVSAPMNVLTSARYWKLSNTANIFSTTTATITLTTGADDNIGSPALARVAQGGYGSTFTSRGGTYTGTTITSTSAIATDSIFVIGTEATGLPVRWTGGAGTSNWGDALNWSNSAVPTLATDVNLSSAVAPINTYPVYINVNVPTANVANLIVGANVVLDLKNTTLNIAGKYNQVAVTNANYNSLVFANNSTINMTGNDSFLVAAGTFNGGNGTINFSNAITQWIRPSGGTCAFNHINLTGSDKNFLAVATYTVAGNLYTDAASMISLSGATGTTFNVGGNFTHSAIAAGTNSTSLTVSCTGMQSIITCPNAASTPNLIVATGSVCSLGSNITMNTGSTFTVNGRLNAGLNTISGAGAFSMIASGTLGTEQVTAGVGGTILMTNKTFTAGSQIDYNANGSQAIDAISHPVNSSIMVSVGGTKTLNGALALVTTGGSATNSIRVAVFAQNPASYSDGGNVLSLNGTFNHINIMKGAGYITSGSGGLRFGGNATGSYIRVPDGVNLGTLELNFTNVASTVEFQSSEPSLLSNITLTNLYVGVTTPANGGALTLSRTDLGTINLNITGNFTIGNTGASATGTLQCKSNNVYSTVTLNGNFSSANTSATQPIIGSTGFTTLVMNGTTGQSFVFSGAPSVTFLSAPLDASVGEGVLKINNSSNVVFGDATARTYYNAGILELTGNGTIAPTATTTFGYNQVSGTLRYSNSTGAIVTTDTEFPSANSPFNLIIASTGTGSVTLHAPKTINGNLFLRNGYITTSASALLSVGSSNTLAGSCTRFQGWVNGPLSRWVANSTGSREWMIGNANGMYPVTLTHTTVPTGGYVTATYVSGANSVVLSPTLPDGITLNVRSGSYWQMDTLAAGIGSAVYSITVNSGTYPGVNDPASLRVIRSDDAGTTFYASGTHSDGATGFYNRTGIANGMGRFYLAGNSITNPLPVKLMTFTASNNDGDVDLFWITASEENNKGFVVERSADGKSFEETAFVKGAGYSSEVQKYILTDAKAFEIAHSNTLYYRLKQLDYNGEYTYSEVVVVSNETKTMDGVSVYPNPFEGSYNVTVSARTENTATIEMMDLHGKQVMVHTAAVVKGTNTIPMDNISALPQGIYFVKVSMNGESHVLKLIKR